VGALMDARQLWIFRVSGGQPFRIQVKGSPAMKHDGGTESILRTLCTDEQAGTLEQEMRSFGGRVSAYAPRETKEQKAERQNVMSLLGGDRPFPSARCPECSWFDPHLESLCGAGIAPGGEGWADEVVLGTLKADPKHRTDFDQCPLRQEITN
jgi:hypothetical protein